MTLPVLNHTCGHIDMEGIAGDVAYHLQMYPTTAIPFPATMLI